MFTSILISREMKIWCGRTFTKPHGVTNDVAIFTATKFQIPPQPQRTTNANNSPMNLEHVALLRTVGKTTPPIYYPREMIR